ncbi:MAG: Multidrug resistance protein Stp [Chlamydiales bacterium]|nr:Multidrug resistance protein Stp [Chlamydiales bacterium]MCH9619676.1 Multidrug resistance protein Stp [Chlamydiales bacterium]MCH9623282.1 Multidrug resistance protein Stp [Chlamydiales bacterium]
MAAKEGKKWFIIWVTVCSSFLFVIDPTITPLMIAEMQKEFQISQTDSIWILNAYLLTFASLLLIGGRLIELLGYRRLYIGGFLLFGAGAVIVALSQTFSILIGGRIVEGIGGGLLMPSLAAMTVASFPRGMRGRALAAEAAITSILVLFGILGGGFVITDFSWRWIFVGYLPFVLIGIILCLWVVKPGDIVKKAFPFLGSLLLIIGMALTTGALMEGGRFGFKNIWILISLIGGPLFLILHVINALKSSNSPLADFRLFKSSVFSWINVLRFLMFLMVGASNLWVVYFGSNLGYPSSTLGTLIFIAQLPAFIAAFAGGFLSDRLSYRVSLSLGFGLMIFAFTWVSIFYGSKNVWLFLPGLMGYTSAFPILMSQTMSLGLSHVDSEKLGTTSGLMATIQQFGQSIGVAFLLAIFIAVENITDSDFSGFLGLNLAALLFGLLGLGIVWLCFKKEQLCLNQ